MAAKPVQGQQPQLAQPIELQRGVLITHVLNGIKASELTGTLQKALCYRALELLLCSATDSERSHPTMRYEIEELKQATCSPNIVDLQKNLAATGRRDLAKRVAKRAKGRHAEAHPDPGLLKDIKEHIDADKTKGTNMTMDDDPGPADGEPEEEAFMPDADLEAKQGSNEVETTGKLTVDLAALSQQCSEKDTTIASLHKEIETRRGETTVQLQTAKTKDTIIATLKEQLAKARYEKDSFVAGLQKDIVNTRNEKELFDAVADRIGAEVIKAKSKGMAYSTR